MISGGRDVQGINDICALLARDVPGAELEVFEDSDHLPMYREPERFNELVLEFLESHAPPELLSG